MTSTIEMTRNFNYFRTVSERVSVNRCCRKILRRKDAMRKDDKIKDSDGVFSHMFFRLFALKLCLFARARARACVCVCVCVGGGGGGGVSSFPWCILSFPVALFRLFAWCLFVYSYFRLASFHCERTKWHKPAKYSKVV